MNLKAKQLLIALLGFVFLGSLLFVQWMEVARKRQEAGLAVRHVSIPASSRECIACHDKLSPGIIDHWEGSTHAVKGVGCVECHQADEKDAGRRALPLPAARRQWKRPSAVTYRPCSRIHPTLMR